MVCYLQWQYDTLVGLRQKRIYISFKWTLWKVMDMATLQGCGN